MGKTTLRLDTRRALQDGTYPVQIVVGHGTNIYLGTGIYADTASWDASTRMYVGKGAKSINNALSAMLSAVVTRIMDLKASGQWVKLTRPQIRQMLTNLDLETPTVDIPSLGDIMERMLVGRRDGTKYIAKTAINRLQLFSGKDVKDIALDSITRPWLDDFYASMSDLAVNTKSTYMRCLRRAFNYALERDITENNPFKHYYIPLQDTRMRVLPIAKMRQLLNLETRYHYTEYRDMFMLTFYLIGINTVDLSQLTHDNVVDGRIEYRRAKTGKLYSIKVWPEAAAILEKYKGEKHLLSVFDRCSNYKAYQGTMNNALTRIGVPQIDESGQVVKAKNGQAKMVPLEKDLSIYWARYSWATYAADLDIPKDTISEALGHSHGAKVTGVYIRYNRDKVDAANRKVIDYVLGK